MPPENLPHLLHSPGFLTGLACRFILFINKYPYLVELLHVLSTIVRKEILVSVQKAGTARHPPGIQLF